MKFRDYDNYEIYEDGRIYSYFTNKFLKPVTMPNGYQNVVLVDNEGKNKMYLLHRIVYESFTGEPIPEGMQVNHIDECKTNNKKSNLNLLTPKQNINWGSGIERSSKSRKKTLTNNPKISKAVGAFKNNELIMTFPSTMECGRQGFNSGNVAACCRGKLQHYKGYTWKYI